MKDYPHLDQWLEAMAEETKTLKDKGCWVECLKSEAYENGEKIVPNTWVLRVKRSPAGEIIKQKGRICVRQASN